MYWAHEEYKQEFDEFIYHFPKTGNELIISVAGASNGG